MTPPRHGTCKELADLYLPAQEEIMNEWRARAQNLLQDLNLDKLTITDHLPDIVAEIIRDLDLSRDGTLSEEHTRGSPPAHGVQRFHDGLNVGEVVTEYNLLRVAFNTVAASHGYFVAGEAAHIINHRIDEAVRLAVMSFAAQQALIRKEQQDENLAFIVHDLRTPLNAVSLMVSELRSGLDGKILDDMDDVFDILTRNLGRLEELIKKVLESNTEHRTPASSFNPERRAFELRPLVEGLLHDLKAVSAANVVNVKVEIPQDLSVYADAGLLSQVFQNLLSNAFKYATQGKVTIYAHETDGLVTCIVRDNGTGIPLDMLSRVFDKHATDPEKEGTGLGLAIVKQIVQSHNGTVSAASTHGLGATFTFTIPGQAQCDSLGDHAT